MVPLEEVGVELIQEEASSSIWSSNGRGVLEGVVSLEGRTVSIGTVTAGTAGEPVTDEGSAASRFTDNWESD